MKDLLSFVSVNTGVELSYRFLHTPAELYYAIINATVKPSDLLYLSLHGRPNFIHTGEDTEFDISLDELSTAMEDKYKKCGVHFASCAVLSSDEDLLKRFLKETGVTFVSGYKEYVDFGDSSILDLALLIEWSWSTYSKPMLKKLIESHPVLVERNGFSFI